MLKKDEIIEIIEENQNIDNLKKTYEIAKEYTHSGIAFCEIDIEDSQLNFGWKHKGQRSISEFTGDNSSVVIISIETPVEDISPEDMLDEKEVEGYYDYLEENEYKSVDDYVLDRYSKTELDNRMYEIYNEFEERKVFFKDLDFIEEEVIQTLLKKAPQWLSATETADILGITSRAIRLNCENGKYESRKAGGVWIINKDSVIESLR